MPRKSPEAIQGEWFRRLNAPPPPPRPKPPKYLSKRAAAIWREIVESKPSNYFDAANQHLLAGLCVSAWVSEVVTKEMSTLDLSDPKQFRRYRSLSIISARQSKLCTMLSTKLRLLPTKQQAMAFA